MKVIIWGCGDFGRQVLPKLVMQENVEIVAYTDSNENIWGTRLFSFPVISPRQVLEKEFDKLMIVVSSPDAVRQIKESIDRLGIQENKVIDTVTNIRYMDLFVDQRVSFIDGYSRWIRQNSIEGNVAECGVFRGDSAKFINRSFFDRTLYLCDTFEGFDKSDLWYEKEMDNEGFKRSRFANQSYFLDTCIAFVMCKMTYPENIVVKKGYFPESMQEIEDKFCFVNLDMDLHIPMLNGLRFFWDKMVENGCILLHDYFSDIFTGVKQAVDTFEQERNINIIKTPIGDGCSIALFKG